jgi:casein kinase II subunit alpha
MMKKIFIYFRLLNISNEFNINMVDQSITLNRLPRMHADALATKDLDYYSYETMEIVWNSTDPYEVIKKVGHGKYSEVFQGIDSRNNNPVIIKILKPVKFTRYNREIKILRNLEGCPNIIKLLDIVKDQSTNTPALIFEYVNNTHFRTLYPKLNDFEIRYYLYELLKALEFSHSMGIMHRDVKPHNVMIDHNKRQLKLIDWGLAEFYKPGTNYNVGVASRYFKGPELLMDDESYNYSLDMWSLGAMMAGLIFRKDPFFHGRNNHDQLAKIAKIMGTKDLMDYIEKYNIQIDPQLTKLITRNNPRNLLRFVNKDVHHLVSVEALDLMSKMLKYDPIQRILPAEAMQHPYFLPVTCMWNDVEHNNDIDLDSPSYETAQILLNSLTRSK